MATGLALKFDDGFFGWLMILGFLLEHNCFRLLNWQKKVPFSIKSTDIHQLFCLLMSLSMDSQIYCTFLTYWSKFFKKHQSLLYFLSSVLQDQEPDDCWSIAERILPRSLTLQMTHRIHSAWLTFSDLGSGGSHWCDTCREHGAVTIPVS